MTTRGLIPLAGMLIAVLMVWLTVQGEEQLAAVVVFGFLSLCGVVLVARGSASAERPLGLFLLAFGIRAIAAIAVYEGGLVKLLGDDDATGWQWGWTQAEVWRGHVASAGGLPPSLLGAFGKGNHGYVYLVALLLYPLGVPSRLAVAFLNAFFGALTVVLVYRIAARLFTCEVARIAAVLTTFFPSLIIWSAQTLKEPVVIFCECLIVYALIRLRESFSLRYLAYMLLGVLLVSTLRFYVAYLALGVLAMTLLIPRTGGSSRSFIAGLLALALAIPLLRGLGFLNSASEHMSYLDLHFIEQFRAGASIGPGTGSSIQTDVDVTTPHGAALATVIGVAHLMLAPFPWQLGGASLRMLLTLPELVIWWWLLFFGIVPGLRHALRRHFVEIQPLLLFIIPLSLLYGLMFTNIGLVFRQRAQLLPFYLIFAGVGLVLRRQRQSERWAAAQSAHAQRGNQWRTRLDRRAAERSPGPLPVSPRRLGWNTLLGAKTAPAGGPYPSRRPCEAEVEEVA